MSSIRLFYPPSCFPFCHGIARYAFGKTVAIRTNMTTERIGNLITGFGLRNYPYR